MGSRHAIWATVCADTSQRPLGPILGMPCLCLVRQKVHPSPEASAGCNLVVYNPRQQTIYACAKFAFGPTTLVRRRQPAMAPHEAGIMPGLVHSIWPKIAVMKAHVWIDRVPTRDSIADLPSRAKYTLFHTMGAEFMEPVLDDMFWKPEAWSELSANFFVP